MISNFHRKGFTYKPMMRSGIILVELNRDRLHQLLDQMSTNNSGSILIIDDEGNMVVPNETIRSSQIIETIAAPNHSRIQMNLNDEEYLIYTQKSPINFWTYIWMVPCSILNHSSSSIITRMLLIHIVFFLAVVVGSYFLSREMFLPFISLYNRMIGKDTRGNSYLLKRLAIMSELDKGITQMRGELAEVRASGNIIRSENVALREQINQYTREYCDRFVQRLIDGSPIGSTEISGLVEMEHIPVDCSSVIAEAADYISDLMRIIQEKYHAIPKRARKIAEQAREIIHNEFATDISLQETAERLGVNASYLSRIFKESIGINFKEYLIEYKLTIAKKLLEEGINVTKVAEKVGYQDVRQFTRIFKKYMGVTPNVYQTSHKT